MMMTNRRTPDELFHCVQAAQEKKAEDLLVLDLHDLSDVTDYFVICHGTSDRQVAAIADNIEERLRHDAGCRPANIEGRRQAQWILLDYLDFVVHVFLDERRDFYRLDRLWGDAPRLDLANLDPSRARRTSSGG